MKKEEHTDLNRVQIQDEEGRSKPQQNPFPIIGMGGASGSLPAFETFFKHMPAQSGMAFVIVMHQDSKENTDYISLLKSFSSLPVLFAADGTKLKPDHIYLAPKDIDVGLHDGHLLLFNASREKGAHMCIDHFFQSLAEDQWNMAVGIVFSGLGADGETGIRMIKEKLGMTMVQDPETAEYPSMPLASIKTQLTDYILPVEEMPMKLIQYLSHPALRASIEEEVDPGKNNRIHVQKILMLLRSHTGHDFSLYKKTRYPDVLNVGLPFIS
ncbi:chemotaxis protein CheB [Sphingobacterium pedocola]|uniref:protein-glutamate methylesterase n=1 Tax=Sphingobacterium pedocola TaxID=2082722 RepID=A0ABR9TEF3_9SPHI|nr:chemotaxis protein CheB [Sphingobacterium pedocola]MBE8723037.1 hypothetical protein [Sphingobacterium pedocola]